MSVTTTPLMLAELGQDEKVEMCYDNITGYFRVSVCAIAPRDSETHLFSGIELTSCIPDIVAIEIEKMLHKLRSRREGK